MSAMCVMDGWMDCRALQISITVWTLLYVPPGMCMYLQCVCFAGMYRRDVSANRLEFVVAIAYRVMD